MRRLLVGLALAVVSVSTLSGAPDELLYTRFEKYLEALRIQAGIPGMVAAVVGENDIVWSHPFGRQDVERSIPTRVDTPFHLDGLTQIITATLVLQCVEQGRLDLDDPISKHDEDSPEGRATIRQVLSHTSPAASGLTFAYRPERFDQVQTAVRDCTGDSFRETVANLLDQLSMNDSVPGRDVLQLVPPDEGVPDLVTAERYTSLLARLTTSYAVLNRRTVPVVHTATRLTAASGLISTVQDLAKFDVALKQGLLSPKEGLLTPETLAEAWTLPAQNGLQPVPHGLGWFVQLYNGELVVWQFGISESSSSFVMSLPARRLTMILLANSDGLVKPFVLTSGVVTASPFARVYLGLLGL